VTPLAYSTCARKKACVKGPAHREKLTLQREELGAKKGLKNSTLMRETHDETLIYRKVRHQKVGGPALGTDYQKILNSYQPPPIR